MTNALGHGPALRWLEPSFGRGAFIREIAALGVEKRDIVGVDLDARPSNSDLLATPLRGVEFLAWSATQEPAFDRIIGNPPFIAIERLRGPLRKLAADMKWGSIAATGSNGNLWGSFLVASLRLLRPGGSLSFILPAAWGYADYAADLRRKLPTYFREFVCHRSLEPLFPTVQDGCYVIQCFGFGEPNKISSSHFYKEASDLTEGLRPPVRPSLPSVYKRSCSPSVSSCKASSLFEVHLGAVTGDASYFLLSEERRRKLELPLDSVLPVVTRARHLRSALIRQKDWKAIRDGGDRAYLFRPGSDSLNNDSVQAYLRLAKKQGGCNQNAGWVQRRNPWYSVALPTRVDGFMSGVSSSGPLITLNSMRRLAATNTLYVISFAPSLHTNDLRAACALSLVTTYARAQVVKKTRMYAGGMQKLEPCDILGLVLPVKENVSGAHVIYQAVAEQLIEGNEKIAMSMADDWFASR